MPLSVETVNRLLASGRNYASTIVGFIGGVGIMSASQSKGLSDALGEIFNGLSMIVHGATSAWAILLAAFPIIGIVMAQIASRSATSKNQATQLQAAVQDPATPIDKETAIKLIDAVTNLDIVKKDQSVIKVTDPVVANQVPSGVVQTAH